MEIVISTSPHIKHASVLESDFQPRSDLMYSFAPLGILMLCACVKKDLNIIPTIFDLNRNINNNQIQNDENFYTIAAVRLLSTDPDIVGFMTECDSYHHVLQICNKIKEIKPACYIILGGPHATAVGLPTMERWKCIDCIVLGEGEVTFTELIKNRINGSPDTIVPGTIMRNNTGQPVTGPKRALIDNLDKLPYPAYDLYTPDNGEELFLEAGRGCPFQCTFCSTSPFWERKHRVKSPGRIAEEMAYLQSIHKAERVHLTHDLFTANQTWAENVCHQIIESNIKIKWTCSSRIDTVSEPLIRLMSKAGCNAIFFGIESGSDRILQEIDKRIPFEKTCEIIEVCLKYNITPNAGLILGFPTEDEQSFRATFDAYLKLLKMGIKPLHLFSYCPFVQSSIYKTLKGLKFTGNLLDIPLPNETLTKNNAIINGDQELFGSYFKPSLAKQINGLKDEVISAIDEFALLVDTVRLPSILVSERLGGMDRLFFEWISFIAIVNAKKKKSLHRRYFGGSIDYCEFLIGLNKGYESEFQSFINDLLRVMKTNLEISNQNHSVFPTTMATYRSRMIEEDLINVKLDSKISVINIIDFMRMDYNVVCFLNSLDVPETVPEKQSTNFAWQKNEDGSVSLIQLNDFMYHLVELSSKGTSDIKWIIDTWLEHPHQTEQLNLADVFEDLKIARDRNIITISSL